MAFIAAFVFLEPARFDAFSKQRLRFQIII